MFHQWYLFFCSNFIKSGNATCPAQPNSEAPHLSNYTMRHYLINHLANGGSHSNTGTSSKFMVTSGERRGGGSANICAYTIFKKKKKKKKKLPKTFHNLECGMFD
jgi:hypothetical protein